MWVSRCELYECACLCCGLYKCACLCCGLHECACLRVRYGLYQCGYLYARDYHNAAMGANIYQNLCHIQPESQKIHPTPRHSSAESSNVRGAYSSIVYIYIYIYIWIKAHGPGAHPKQLVPSLQCALVVPQLFHCEQQPPGF